MPEPEVVYVRVSRTVKAEIQQAAEQAGMTLNTWCANTLANAARGQGFPPPPQALPLPGAEHALTSYMTGERLLGPCGQHWPCRAGTEPLEDIGGISYCPCGIRVS